MSRIGKKPVPLPSGVTAIISGQTVEVKGPKGTRSFHATDDVTLALVESALQLPLVVSRNARVNNGAWSVVKYKTWSQA